MVYPFVISFRFNCFRDFLSLGYTKGRLRPLWVQLDWGGRAIFLWTREISAVYIHIHVVLLWHMYNFKHVYMSVLHSPFLPGAAGRVSKKAT